MVGSVNCADAGAGYTTDDEDVLDIECSVDLGTHDISHSYKIEETVSENTITSMAEMKPAGGAYHTAYEMNDTKTVQHEKPNEKLQSRQEDLKMQSKSHALHVHATAESIYS